MNLIRLGVKPRPADCEIYIGRGILNQLPSLLSRRFNGGRAVLVTDKNLAPTLGGKLASSLRKAGWRISLFVPPAGEKAKSLGVVENLYDHLLRNKTDRRTPLIALGGGTVGDAAGFAAATYYRGIPLVQVPTTLIAQVDSAIGGKTGVNHPLAKNAIGAFYQPSLVVADAACLKTLPPRQMASGMAEVVKYALVFDPGFAKWLSRHWNEIESQKPGTLVNLVRRCILWKAKIVREDELDLSGRRELLNFGHTIGHALETATSYGTFLHGEAVAWGMRAAVGISERRGWLNRPGEAALARGLLGRLPARPWPKHLKLRAVLKAMGSDKKVRGSKNVFVLLRGFGRPVRVDDVSEGEILEALR